MIVCICDKFDLTKSFIAVDVSIVILKFTIKKFKAIIILQIFLDLVV